MRVRFTVRPDDEDPGRFAVWDGSVHGWRARGIADEPAATRKAAELELKEDAYGERNPKTVRDLEDEPQKVEIRNVEWVQAGDLYAWLWVDQEWYGLVCDDDGRMSYVLGTELRPKAS